MARAPQWGLFAGRSGAGSSNTLFTAFFDAGVVVVATSNRAADGLYERGPHRERLLPFIALLKKKLYVLKLDGGRDYRLDRLLGKPVYHFPLRQACAPGAR
jgi:cell division protein ZapE